MSAWANSTESISHYDGDGDEPSWIANDVTLPYDITRYVEGMDGALAVQTGKSGDRVLQLVDLHGDVTATVPIADEATTATWTELRFTSFDEFGVPQPMTSGATSNAPPARYGWLGAAQRSADTPTGVILMGVRLYEQASGRFLQPDPVAGGSANTYDYCNADPVNCTDLGGTWTWKGLVKGVAKVSEVASWIPGPIGAAAGGISAVAYGVSGNKAKALEMGISAAAQMVGAGAGVRAGFKAASVAAKAGNKGRGVAKAARACNSFLPGTLVRVASGDLVPIETLETGDLILGEDPVTGETTTETVLDPIEGVGTKHLIEISVSDAVAPVVATAKHPYWVVSKGWVEAADLTVGDRLEGSFGTISVISGVRNLGWHAEQVVHNLHTSGPHTYFVAAERGFGDQLVHNEECNVSPSDVHAIAVELGYKKQRGLRGLNDVAAWVAKKKSARPKYLAYDSAQHGGTIFKGFKDLDDVRRGANRTGSYVVDRIGGKPSLRRTRG